MSELRFALQSLSKDMAVEQPDGSWIVEREVKWPFERISENTETCEKTQVGISARNKTSDGKNIEAELYVRDCTLEGRKTIALLQKTEDGKVTMDFDFSALRNMEGALVKVDDRCVFRADMNTHEYGLVCNPFETKVGAYTLRFGDVANGYGIWYATTPAGEETKMNISAYKSDGTLIGDVSVEGKPGQKTVVKMNRKSAL